MVLDGRSYDAPDARARTFTNSANTFVYDPKRNAWTSGPPLPEGRSGFAAQPISPELIYIAGGEKQGDLIRSAIIFNPETGISKQAPAPSYDRHAFALINDGANLWAIGGGVNPRFSVSDVVEIVSLQRLIQWVQ